MTAIALETLRSQKAWPVGGSFWPGAECSRDQQKPLDWGNETEEADPVLHDETRSGLEHDQDTRIESTCGLHAAPPIGNVQAPDATLSRGSAGARRARVGLAEPTSRASSFSTSPLVLHPSGRCLWWELGDNVRASRTALSSLGKTWRLSAQLCRRHEPAFMRAS